MWVRIRDVSLISELRGEPFHLRNRCELPSHTGSGLGANPSDEQAAEHITELPSHSQDLHPNAGLLLYLKGKKNPKPDTEKCEALRVVFPPLSPLLSHEDAG